MNYKSYRNIRAGEGFNFIGTLTTGRSGLMPDTAILDFDDCKFFRAN